MEENVQSRAKKVQKQLVRGKKYLHHKHDKKFLQDKKITLSRHFFFFSHNQVMCHVFGM